MDVAHLGFDVDGRPLRKGTDDLNKFGRAGTKAGGDIGKMSIVAKKGFSTVALAAGAALAAMASLGAVINTIKEFDSSMARLGAITGATTEEFMQMRDVAKDLGASTEFSAKQAADGLTFLGMAGFSASESIAAIPAVLDLATAAGLGLAEAADTTSNIMSGFGIAAENSANVADVLAAASSRANTDVSQLGQAMSTVAPIAAALEIDLADTAAAIGVMSDAGIQGSRAGTAMRGVLASLAGPSREASDTLKDLGLTLADIDPATNSLSTVMGRLGDAGLTTAQAMAIFGREAASGALVLVDGAKRLGDFGEELRNVDGAASEMATTIRDNLGGDIDSLLSSLSGLMIALGDAGLTAILRGVIGAVTDFTRAVTATVDALSGFVGGLSGFITGSTQAQRAIDNVTLAMGDEIGQVNKLIDATRGARTMSLDVAGVKLAQARAHLEVVDAARQERLELAKSNGQYQRAVSLQSFYNDEIAKYNQIVRDSPELEGPQDAENFRRYVEGLKQSVELQRILLGDAGELSPEYIEAQKAIAELEAAILNSKDGMVTLGDEIVTANDLSDRLAVAASNIKFDAAIADAARLVKTLGVSLQIASRMASFGLQTNAPSGGRGADPTANGGSILDWNTRKAIDFDANWTPPKVPSGGSGGRKGGSSRESNDQQREAQRIIDGLKTSTERYNEELAALNDLQKVGFLSAEQFTQAQENLKTEFMETEFDEYIRGIDGVANAWGEFSSNGFKDFDGFVNNVLRSWQGMLSDMVAEQARSGLLDLLGGGGQSSGGGIFSKIIGGIFGGFRANGGGVNQGSAYVINENTPNSEVFVPSQNGAVLNVPQAQAALRGAGGGGAQEVVVRVVGGDLVLSDGGQIMTGVKVVAESTTAAGIDANNRISPQRTQDNINNPRRRHA